MKNIRKIKTWLGTVVCLALVLSLLLPTMLVRTTPVTAATIWYVDDSGGADFLTIQEAIDAATEGDTIIVRDGTYVENTYISKSLNIQSENGSASTVVQAADPELDVFFVVTDDVTIDGFTVEGVTAMYYGGITLYGDEDPDGEITGCVIKNNECSNNDCGITLFVGSNNTFESNTASNCRIGIYLNYATNNVVTCNTFTDNDYAVNLDTASANILHLNNFISSAISHITEETPGSSSGNIWNSQTQETYWYSDSQYSGYIGNYWDDYSGTDTNGDGIGDTAYQTFTSPDEYDDYPLMGEWCDGVITPHIAPVAEFTASVPQDCIQNGSFETGELSPWTASSLVLYGDTAGVQLFTTESSKKIGSVGLRLWRTPAEDNIWIEQDVDLTDIDAIRFWRYQYGMDSSQELQVLVDGTIIAVFNEASTVNNYTTVDLSSYGYSGVHTLKFNAYNGYTSGATFSLYLDDITAFGPGTSGYYPLVAIFKDLSTNNPTSWAWDFDNDGTIDDTTQNPVNTYSAAGTYTVKLTATNDYGSDDEIKTDFITATPRTWYVDDSGGADFLTIQEAVTAAGAGDTIIVMDGTYVENIIIDDHVTPGNSSSGDQDRTGLVLQSENGSGAVTVTSATTIDPVFYIYIPEITIDGFTITGIYPYTACSGISINSDAANGYYTFINNVFIDVSNGIRLFNARAGHNTISNNTISLADSGNSFDCIYVKNSSDNIITNNTCSGTDRSGTSGIRLQHDIESYACTNNMISGNTFDGCGKGIYIYSATANSIFSNTISNSVEYGIYLKSSSSLQASDNVLYANNIVNSTTADVYFYDAYSLTNYWNSPTAQTYWFNGTQYSGQVGNYWSSYTGVDADGNGIGDTAYQTRTSPTEYDNYPLMGEWHDGEIMSSVTPVADFAADVTSGDASLLVNFTDLSANSPTSWEWDFDNDGTVDSYDQNPSYTYTAAGTYTVKLTVTNSAGSDEEIKTDYITVYVPQPEWDINGDHICNIGDVVVLGLHWEETGTPGWIPEDLNSDGIVNIGDVVVLGLHWEETW